MTKKQFIEESKRFGFSHYKAFVAKLGYHERTLDRYKEDDEISKKFVKSFEQYRDGTKPIEKADLGDIKVREIKNTEKKKTDAKKTTQNTKHKTQIKEITQNTENTEIYTETTQKENIGVDISNDEYHASERMSVSKIKVMIDNAKEFESRYIKKDFEQKETDALVIGRLHHTLVMEPHKFNDDYIVLDLPARPVKEDLVNALEDLGGSVEMKENSKGEIVVADTVETLKEKIDQIKKETKKVICTKQQLEIAQATSEKALNSIFELVVNNRSILKAQLRDILSLPKCYVEKTFYGVIEGVEVQVRPDILVNLGAKTDVWFVIDLKTMEVSTPKEFIKQGGNFFWDMQEQFYIEVLKQNEINVKAFYFNCTGKKEWSGAQFHEWGITTKEDAKKIVIAGMRKYKYCVENSIFLESKFDFRNLKFEAITTSEVPAYRQHQLGDLGL
jgi:hypothetical protein